MPLLRSAERTRSRLSLTDASGSPTTSKPGIPPLRSTSTATGKPFMPLMPRLMTLASIVSPPKMCKHYNTLYYETVRASIVRRI